MSDQFTAQAAAQSTAQRFPLARGTTPPRARNVLLFLTDQQRKDSIGAYGGPGGGFQPVTPALDRLAAEGTRFERCYGTNPFCCPSRASLLTGLYPRTHGVWDNGVQFDDVRPTTLGDLLQGQGYRTGCVGKLHLNAWFRQHPPRGYEESQDYWQQHPEMREWRGPYCGFQEVELTIGHVHYSTRGGHYAASLAATFPEGASLLTRERALVDHGYVETWRNAIPEPYHYNTWIAGRTIAMIDRFTGHAGSAATEHGASNGGNGKSRDDAAGAPFFIQCSFPDPHHPFSACEPYASLFSPDEMPDPIPPAGEELAALPPRYRRAYLGEDREFARNRSFEQAVAGAPLREMMAQMHGMVAHVDRCIGRVVDHLAARGLLEETLIIFSTDHGELLGDHGFLLKGPFFYQGLLNLPLIVRCPGVTPGVRHELVSHVDLVPTALDCLGFEVPGYLPGYSLRGHLEGQPGHVRDAALTEYRPFGENIKVLHTPEWKYVYYYGQRYGELFHLSADPHEHHNRYHDPAYATERRRLQDRLLDELVGTESAWPPKGWWA